MYYVNSPKQIKIGPITTSHIEIRDIAKAWIMISLAFAIILNRDVFSFSFIYTFIFSGLTVGIGFLLHEMGHKIVAQHYGCFAEFRSFDNMLFLALVMSFFGFLFAAPGAVMISGHVGRRRNGTISAAGPAMNLILAAIFLAMLLYLPYQGLMQLAGYGFMINSWLAMFNMIPFGMFDGKKILEWNKLVYGIMLAISLFFVFGGNYFNMLR